MCTLIPVIYPTLRTQMRVTTRSVLPRSNFGMVTRRTPRALLSTYMSGDSRLFTHSSIPTSLSPTGSRALLRFKTAWALIRSPKSGPN